MILIEYGSSINTDTLRRAIFAQYVIDTTDGVTEEEKETKTPKALNIDNIYPNPFNSEVRIKFELYTNSEISLQIYDLSGKLVRILKNGELRTGTYSLLWDAIDYPSGIYFVRLRANRQLQTKKVILIK